MSGRGAGYEVNVRENPTGIFYYLNLILGILSAIVLVLLCVTILAVAPILREIKHTQIRIEARLVGLTSTVVQENKREIQKAMTRAAKQLRFDITSNGTVVLFDKLFKPHEVDKGRAYVSEVDCDVGDGKEEATSTAKQSKQ